MAVGDRGSALLVAPIDDVADLTTVKGVGEYSAVDETASAWVTALANGHRLAP